MRRVLIAGSAAAVVAVVVAVVLVFRVNRGSGPDRLVAVSPGTARSAAACPASKPQTWPTSSLPGLASTLVPGAPRTATVCRYAGLNDAHPRALTVSQLARADVPRLAGALDQARPVPKGRYNCPMDDGAADLIVFRYPSGPDLDVSLATSGCRWAGNGARLVFVPAAAFALLHQ